VVPSIVSLWFSHDSEPSNRVWRAPEVGEIPHLQKGADGIQLPGGSAELGEDFTGGQR